MIEVNLGGQQIRINTPQVNWKLVLAVVIVAVGFAVLKSAIYSVQAEEEGVVKRFGKYIKTVQPGLRFKLPLGIDRVTFVPVRRQLKQEFGFGTESATSHNQWTSASEQELEKQMVTGDLNAAMVEWVIQFRVSEPREYLFNVRNADDTLRHASESIMREVVGDRTVDEVITVGRQEIEAESLVKLQDLVRKYGMGISIDQVQLKNVNPPMPVQASFNEVNQAQQEREKAINIANGTYNQQVPKARGEAQKTIQEAEGYAIQRINEAEGDTAKFNATFTEYRKAPEVTKKRIYLETLQDVMPGLGQKIIIDEDAKQILPLLNLNREG